MSIIGNALRPNVIPKCLTFASPSPFTLEVVNHVKLWEGLIEYSLNGHSWQPWNGVSVINSASAGSSHKIFVRGEDNTFITGPTQSSSNGPWHLIGSNISISGDIATLLDYRKTPTVAPFAFAALFNWPSDDPRGHITDISNLVLSCVGDSCYNGTFSRLTGFTQPPQIPAKVLARRCYYFMFRSCTGLITPANMSHVTTLAEEACLNMYDTCTSLSKLPSLPPLQMAPGSYRFMFARCSSIKMSETRTGAYQTPYRIPTSGTGTDSIDSNNRSALHDMFASTGGTFTGTPSINTTYYTSNEVIS